MSTPATPPRPDVDGLGHVGIHSRVQAFFDVLREYGLKPFVNSGDAPEEHQEVKCADFTGRRVLLAEDNDLGTPKEKPKEWESVLKDEEAGEGAAEPADSSEGTAESGGAE